MYFVLFVVIEKNVLAVEAFSMKVETRKAKGTIDIPNKKKRKKYVGKSFFKKKSN
jgi:hypothetical protein